MIDGIYTANFIKKRKIKWNGDISDICTCPWQEEITYPDTAEKKKTVGKSKIQGETTFILQL